MRGWIWVEYNNMRCYVYIMFYNRRNDTYTVRFADGMTAVYSGNDVFEWNREC